MRYFFSFLLLLLVTLTAQPCGNEYGHTMEGTKVYAEYFYITDDMKTFDTERIQKRLEELRSKVALYPDDHRYWSDLALNLMKLGKADSSIAVLRPLLKEHGGEYNVLANLGTAYELVGELDSALKYISKGLEANPKSHGGSEWIHVRILEAKLKEQQEPGWLHTHAIIEMSELEGRTDKEDGEFSGSQITRELSYQLQTRAPFTPAPNRVMTNLMISLGDFNTLHGTYENALMAYATSLAYQDHIKVENKVKEKIKELNRKRSDLSVPIELERTFKWMMERGKIDPELLVLGLRNYSERIDSFVKEEHAHNDSIQLLHTKLDSVEGLIEAQKVSTNLAQEQVKKRGKKWWPSFLIGLLGGAIMVWLVSRFRKK